MRTLRKKRKPEERYITAREKRYWYIIGPEGLVSYTGFPTQAKAKELADLLNKVFQRGFNSACNEMISLLQKRRNGGGL